MPHLPNPARGAAQVDVGLSSQKCTFWILLRTELTGSFALDLGIWLGTALPRTASPRACRLESELAVATIGVRHLQNREFVSDEEFLEN